MTRNQVVQLSGVLNALAPQFKAGKLSVKALYKLAKIKKVLDEEAQSYKQMYDELMQLIAPFEIERQKLLQEYAEKDENGNLVVNPDGTVKIKEDKRKEFEEKVRNLQKKFEDQLKVFEEKMKEYNEFMNEEVELDIPKLKLDELPDDLPLTLAEMELLMLVVEE